MNLVDSRERERADNKKENICDEAIKCPKFKCGAPKFYILPLSESLYVRMYVRR